MSIAEWLNPGEYIMNEIEIAEYRGMKTSKEEAWNEIEEVHCSLTTLSISEIEDCLDAITDRLEKAMKLLDKEITNE